jgi:phosphoglycerate dehydrogenase-like enzyme
MLSLRKELPLASEDTKRGEWNREKYVAPLVQGDTLGLFGFGNIGSRVAGLADGFGMKVLAFDPYVTASDLPTGVELVDSKTELFDLADIVSIHTPLTDETRGAIGRDEINRLDDDGILINTARGPIIDEDALINALQADAIGGAGLDTFQEEPPPAESPLLEFDNVIVTPHCAGASEESLRGLSVRTAEHVREVHNGRIPETIVNRDGLDL